MILFFLIFFTVYSLINYYLFIRGWQALQGVPALRIIYLVVFVIAASSYIAARMLSKSLPVVIYDALTWIGSFWFAYILYVFLFIVFIDLVRLGNYFFDYYPDFIKNHYMLVKQIVFAAVFLLSSLIIAAGYINTRNIKITELSVDVMGKKPASDKLRIAMVSDFHLSAINNKAFLDDIVNRINLLKPDVVLLPGDIVDDHAEYLKSKNIGSSLSYIKSKYGVYASTGNHEYINNAEEAAKYIISNRINLLRDEAVLVDNKFYIVGREDSSKFNFTGQKRKQLKEIVEDLNPDYPVLLLDHTPFNLNEAANHNIDLQVSGHTHHGQLFPLNLITNMIYEVSRGYKKKNNTHFFVSSGVGTWGPPVRTGSSTEIALIEMRF